MAIFGVLYSIQIKRHEVCSKSVLSLFKVRNDSLDSLQRILTRAIGIDTCPISLRAAMNGLIDDETVVRRSGRRKKTKKCWK